MATHLARGALTTRGPTLSAAYRSYKCRFIASTMPAQTSSVDDLLEPRVLHPSHFVDGPTGENPGRDILCKLYPPEVVVNDEKKGEETASQMGARRL